MNILIIRFSALGDLVTREPTFRAIRYFFPNAHITFLTSEIGKGLYEDSTYFDKILVYKSYIETIKILREKKYDIIFNIQCTKLSHYLVFFLKKTTLINKSHSFFQKFFKLKALTKSLKMMLSLTGLSDNKLNDYMGKEENILINLPFLPKKQENVNIRSIAICTGSSKRWESKKWSIENYIALIKKLLSDGLQVNLVGSSLEKIDEAKILKECPTVVSFVAKTNFQTLKTLLSSMHLFVGNDSGPTHIAAGVGTATLTIFGSTDIKHSPKFGNYRGTHFYIRPSIDVKCHPCYKSICPTKHECMQDITVDNVYSKINEFFKDV